MTIETALTKHDYMHTEIKPRLVGNRLGTETTGKKKFLPSVQRSPL